MDNTVRNALMRFVMLSDALVLVALGLALMVIPDRVLTLFQFAQLEDSAIYIMGMWGAILGTLGIGYYLAASNPAGNLVMIQLGLVRAAIETLFTLFFLLQGRIEFDQAATGIFLPLWFAIAYAVLYPRRGSAPASPPESA